MAIGVWPVRPSASPAPFGGAMADSPPPPPPEAATTVAGNVAFVRGAGRYARGDADADAGADAPSLGAGFSPFLRARMLRMALIPAGALQAVSAPREAVSAPCNDVAAVPPRLPREVGAASPPPSPPPPELDSCDLDEAQADALLPIVPATAAESVTAPSTPPPPPPRVVETSPPATTVPPPRVLESPPPPLPPLATAAEAEAVPPPPAARLAALYRTLDAQYASLVPRPAGSASVSTAAGGLGSRLRVALQAAHDDRGDAPSAAPAAAPESTVASAFFVGVSTTPMLPPVADGGGSRPVAASSLGRLVAAYAAAAADPGCEAAVGESALSSRVVAGVSDGGAVGGWRGRLPSGGGAASKRVRFALVVDGAGGIDGEVGTEAAAGGGAVR